MRSPFYNIELFPEFRRLQNSYESVLKELDNALWNKWPSDAMDGKGHCKFLRGHWTICPAYFGLLDPINIKIPGLYRLESEQLIASLPDKFPETTAILKDIPSVNYAGFSRLHGKSSLAPHRHAKRDALILHLGLVIPPHKTCGLKVGTHVHHWAAPGEMVIFDDTFLHSAWNYSDEERIIFYLDFGKS